MSEQTVRGVVEVCPVARGSKSEHVTVVLRTDDRTWLLRRRGGPSFGVDDELAAWAGKTVEVTGFPGTGVFQLTEEPTELR